MNAEDRLGRIAQAHTQTQLGGGVVSGYCNECEHAWPCPTYVWATQDRNVNATWDPVDDDEHGPTVTRTP